MLPSTRVSLSVLALCGSIVASADANLLVDGGFENQAVLQNNPFALQTDGSKWGASWGGSNWGWSSWQGNFNGAWSGGAIARTEDFAAGWKWAASRRPRAAQPPCRGSTPTARRGASTTGSAARTTTR
ncbi:MAG: hypothetical protein NTU45_01220 [Planctomycetota bacterium]|nr:hypothetical protein [Planctomycetota bacterium]